MKQLIFDCVKELIAISTVLVVFLWAVVLTGCEDPVLGPAMEPIVDEVVATGDEPVEPTTNGEVKEPVEEEPTEPITPPVEPAEEPEEEPAEEPADPTEEPVEQEPEEEEPTEPVEEPTAPEEPGFTIALPEGYSLPPYLIPTEPTVLSANEQALINAALTAGRDPVAPPQYFTTNHIADVISVLPYKEREEVYDLFVASVDLPLFPEAAEEMKNININLIILSAEAYQNNNWIPYDNYLGEIEQKQGLFIGGVNPEELRDIYFEENPTLPYQSGVSRYWFILEWYRLQLAHPDLNVQKTLQRYDLLDLYRQSCQDGNIFGYGNPWD